MTKKIRKLGIGSLAALMLFAAGCSRSGQESLSENETTQESLPEDETTIKESPSEPAQSAGLSEISHAVCEPAVREQLGEDFTFYEAVINGILAREEQVPLPGESERDQRILEAVQDQSPYYALVAQADIVTGGVELTYSYMPEEHKAAVEMMDQQFLAFLHHNISGDQNELERLMAVYKGAINQFALDYGYMTEGNQRGGSLLSAVESGNASPYAYARFCVFILGQLGVEAFCAESAAGNIWFIAEIEGSFYHFDPVMEIVNNDGSGLMFFAMSDSGRNKYGNYEYVFAGQKESSLRDLTCSSEQFENFRRVSVIKEEGEHLLRLYTVDELNYLYHTDTMTAEKVDTDTTTAGKKDPDTTTAEKVDPDRLAKVAVNNMYPVFDSIIRTIMEESSLSYAPEDDSFVWGVLYRLGCNYGYLSRNVVYQEGGSGIEIPSSAMKEMASAAFGGNTEIPAIPNDSGIQYQAEQDLYILPKSDMSQDWLQMGEIEKQDDGTWVVSANMVSEDAVLLASYRFVCEPNSYTADQDVIYQYSVTSVTRQ